MKSPINYYAICDTETGGIPKSGEQPVFDVALTEIAIVIVNNAGKIVDKDSWLIKPYGDEEGHVIYSKGAAEATGITKEICQLKGIEIEEACSKCCEFISKYKVGKTLPTLVGHNFKAFDMKFVQNFFEFCNKDITKYFNPHPTTNISVSIIEKICNKSKDEDIVNKLIECLDNLQKVEIIDTLDLAHEMWEESPNFKLGTCCSKVGVELVESHRALPDTVATAEYFCEYLKRVKGEGSSAEGLSKRTRINFEM